MGRLFRPRPKDLYLTDAEARKRLLSTGFFEKHLNGTWDFDEGVRSAVKMFVVNEYLPSAQNPAPRQMRGLFLHGWLGVGKSTVLGLIARGLIRTLYVTPFYTTSENFLDLCSEGRYRDAREFRESPLLFLDDLCWEHIGAGEHRMSKLVELFKYRNARELPTFIASNLDWTDIEARKQEHVGYEQIANLLQDASWISFLNLGHDPSKTKRKR